MTDADRANLLRGAVFALCENAAFRQAFPLLHTTLLIALNDTRAADDAELPIDTTAARRSSIAPSIPSTAPLGTDSKPRKIGRGVTQGEAHESRPGSIERKIVKRDPPPPPIIDEPPPPKKRGPGRPRKPAWKKHADRASKLPK